MQRVSHSKVESGTFVSRTRRVLVIPAAGLLLLSACSGDASDASGGAIGTSGSAGSSGGSSGSAGTGGALESGGSAGVGGSTGGVGGAGGAAGAGAGGSAGASGLACDVVAQDCPAGKCTVTLEGPQLVNVCVEQAGSVGLDSPCARDATGLDDCDAGLFCTVRPGGRNDSTFCRKLCTSDDDCASLGAASVCYILGASAVALAGTCVPPCTLFGNDCTGATHCSLVLDPEVTHLSTACVGETVPGESGDPCDTESDCKAGLTCHPANFATKTCKPICDPAHPCASGGCMNLPLPGPADVGTCLS